MEDNGGDDETPWVVPGDEDIVESGDEYDDKIGEQVFYRLGSGG